MLVVGVHHRDQARIRCALHIVLASQRMQTCTDAANLPSHERQSNQAARVVRAVHMLAHAHAPQNDRCFGRGIQPRHVANGVAINPANRRHLLGAVVSNIRLQRSVVFSAVRDKVGIDQVLRHDDVHHRVQQGHIGIRFELQESMRQARQFALAWIHDDKLRAIVDGVFDPACRDRVVH